MIKIVSLSKTFETKDGNIDVLQDISLHIEKGEIFGVIGMSGAGKSTLIRCINLLEQPTSGTIEIDGKNITDYRGKNLLNLRREMGMIFQNFNLLMQRNVADNVAFPLELIKTSMPETKARVQELLKLVGLEDKSRYFPAQLSGGQKQRVAIARALANSPKILLCDEATSALDTITTNSILDLIKDINNKLGVTIVIITHEMNVVRKVCSRVAVIDNARICEEGRVDDVFSNPRHDITKQIVSFSGGN